MLPTTTGILRHGKTRPGNVIFYEKLIAPLIGKSVDACAIKALEGLSGLAPGDFKSVGDRFAFRNKKDITHEALVSALADEARVKAIHAGQKSIDSTFGNIRIHLSYHLAFAGVM